MSNKFTPEYLGPGIWYVIHFNAAKAVTLQDKESYIKMIKSFCKDFFCDKCKIHLSQFVSRDPPEKSINNLFQWSWRCHNNANTLTGKKLFPYDKAYDLFYGNKGEEYCKESCDVQKNLTYTIEKVRSVSPPRIYEPQKNYLSPRDYLSQRNNPSVQNLSPRNSPLRKNTYSTNRNINLGNVNVRNMYNQDYY